MSFGEMFERFSLHMSERVNVMLPARVIDYDYTQQKATVQPTIRRKYSDGATIDPPLIHNVPVVFPRAGGASLTFPVAIGDTGFVLCSDLDIDEWRNSGGVKTATDPRMHTMNDCVFVCGLVPFSVGSMARNNEDVLITYSGSDYIIKPNGSVVLNAPAGVTVNGNLQINGSISATGTTTSTGNISTSGTISSIGDTVAGGISLISHVHGGVASGGATTSGPQ